VIADGTPITQVVVTVDVFVEARDRIRFGDELDADLAEFLKGGFNGRLRRCLFAPLNGGLLRLRGAGLLFPRRSGKRTHSRSQKRTLDTRTPV